MTAGRSSRTVVSASETAIASLLILKDGRRYYFAPNNESQRLADEDFIMLGFEPVVFPWFDEQLVTKVRSIAGDEALGSDISRSGFEYVDAGPLRWQLLPAEIARYQELGKKTAAAVSHVLLEIRPGMNTREIEARICYQLQCESIEPTVLLIAADERIRRYRHALTQDQTLHRLGMVNICTRARGLVVSITRYVHFGTMPEELERKLAASARVYASLLQATRAGATSAACFGVARHTYIDEGFPGEELEHHQGGAAGYLEREWVARPGGAEVITSPQAFAWNPSVQGAKVEDTIILRNGQIEVITATPELPIIAIEAGGTSYCSAGILMR